MDARELRFAVGELEPHRAARRQPFGGDAEAVARNIEQPRLDALLAERAHTDARAGRPPPRAALFGNLDDRRFETHSLSPRACVPTQDRKSTRLNSSH